MPQDLNLSNIHLLNQRVEVPLVIRGQDIVRDTIQRYINELLASQTPDPSPQNLSIDQTYQSIIDLMGIIKLGSDLDRIESVIDLKEIGATLSKSSGGLSVVRQCIFALRSEMEVHEYQMLVERLATGLNHVRTSDAALQELFIGDDPLTPVRQNTELGANAAYTVNAFIEHLSKHDWCVVLLLARQVEFPNSERDRVNEERGTD